MQRGGLRVRESLQVWARYNLWFIFAALLVLSCALSREFLTLPNIMNLLLRSSFLGLVALGMTMVVLAGGIDLSVGGVFAFAGVFMATLERGYLVRFMPKLSARFEAASVLNPVAPFWVCVALTLACGALIGLVNALLITRFKVPAFVASLGTMVAARGLAFTYTAGFPLPGVSADATWLGSGQVGVIPVPVIVWALAAAAGAALLKYSAFGRKVLAVGGNEKAAWLSGIDTAGTKVMVYVLSGVLAALAGVLMIGRMGAAEPREGAGMELDAIAATVIGGTSLSGGKGSFAGTIAGVLIIGLIGNILNLVEVPPYPQQVAKGLIILAAILMQSTQRRRS